MAVSHPRGPRAPRGSIDISANFDEELSRAQRKVEGIAKRDLNNAVRRAIRAGVKPVRIRIRDRVRAELPKKGGLNTWVGKMPTSRTRFSYGAHPASVAITLDKKGHDFRRMNRTGVVRHPVFYKANDRRKKRWVNQNISGHFFERAVAPEVAVIVPLVKRSISTAIDSAWRKR